MKSIVSIIFLGTLMVSCAKDKAYDEVKNPESDSEVVVNTFKRICTVSDPCVMVPTVGDIPYQIAASRPYWQGEAKLVAFSLDKTKLNIVQIETDSRFQEVENNMLPVASFDIEYKDYRCAKDANGKCSNKEELDDEKHWSKKKYAQIDMNSFTKLEINTLPIEMSSLYQKGCFTELTQAVNKADIVSDGINISYTKTYNASSDCVELREYSDLNKLTFAIDYTYSIVKLSSLADKNYKKIVYSENAQSKFGFFKTDRTGILVDNTDHTADARESYLNRFSPNKKEIVYHLTKEFYYPENKYLLDTTKEGILTINRSLKQAKAPIRLTLEDGRGKNPADLRYNFIIFVNDPQKSGTLGYGPSISNPLTGEILKAQNVMYYGTLVSSLSRTYDEIVDENLAREAREAAEAEAQVQATGTAAATASESSVGSAESHDHGAELTGNNISNLSQKQIIQLEKMSNLNMSEKLKNLLNRKVDFVGIAQRNLLNVDDMLADQLGTQGEITELKTEIKTWNRRLAEFSKNNLFHESQFNMHSAITSSVDMKSSAEYKTHWDDLKEKERSKILKKVMPHAWNFALVHELGHNLGLRHNFAGSTDKTNYYSNRELTAMNVKMKKIPYSSVMDYPYSGILKLPIMGKYDVAALKYAYARKVTDVAGVEHTIETSLDELLQPVQAENSKPPVILKDFTYCTDEHVGTDTLCNRFDSGTNSVGVAQHYINDFKKWDEKRTTRGRRYRFSAVDDARYYVSMMSNFYNIRQFFDRYDIEVSYGIEKKALELIRRQDDEDDILDAEEKLAIKNYLETKKASDLSFEFLLGQIDGPGYNCAIYDIASQTITVKPFVQLSEESSTFGYPLDFAKGCEYLGYMEARAAQEAGKEATSIYLSFGDHMNNTMDHFSGNKRAPGRDQIDIRGRWLNKIVASQLITLRPTRPSVGENSSGNYLDHKEYKEQFDVFLEGLFTNSYKKEVKVTNVFNGISLDIVLPYGFDRTHNVSISYHPGINYFFGLKTSSTDFKTIMMSKVKENVKVGANSTKDDSLYHSMHVMKLSSFRDVDDQRFEKTVIFRNKVGRIQGRFGVWKDGEIGIKLSKIKDEIDAIEGVNNYAQVIEKFLEADSEADLPEELKPFSIIPGSVIAKHISGEEVIEVLNQIPTDTLLLILQYKEESIKKYEDSLSEAEMNIVMLYKKQDPTLNKVIEGTLSSDILLKSFLSLAQ